MGNLNFHFLNVGKGNCSVIDFTSGRLTVIDIDDSRAISYLQRSLMKEASRVELTNPIDYIISNFPNREIFRFILTHPDMDHMSGIKRLFEKKVVSNFWDTDNQKYINPDNWEDSQYDKEDWNFYQKIRKINGNPKALKLYRGQSGNYWTDDGIKILSPTPELVKEVNESNDEDYDHLSYVLRIHHAGKKVLLGGDATKEAWDDIIAHYVKGHLKSDVLLAPNHGSSNHISKEILDEINPDLTVVSVAEGVDYAYELYKNCGTVLSTKHYGNIGVTILDTGEIYFQTQLQEYNGQWHRLTRYPTLAEILG
ncbi:MAG: hypothetical protein HY578_06405 [Nitrospinae bacterium]|nr:hypothetical protein [Nitrospinota bacterium]